MVVPIKRIFDVACYGTSLTTGRLSTAWPAELERALAQAVDRPVRIYDLGKGGQTSDWGVANMGRAADRNPRLILFEGFAINDCAIGPVTRAQHGANIDTMVAYWRSRCPATRLCIQTMSPASSGDSFRTNLGDYYADEISRAAALGIDCLNHYDNWPKPLPTALTQLDPATGLPDGLHPTLAANRQYFFPTVVNYLVPLILAAP